MLVDSYKVIDADTHITEPPDLWSSRVGTALREHAPRVVWDERKQFERWVLGEKRLGGVAASAASRWTEFPPSYPPTLDEADPASWNPVERLKRMDEEGIYAQVLYPNLLGFSQHTFLTLPDEALRLACIKAYNDFTSDFASEAPKRFAPVMVLPVWDMDLAVAELNRCIELGHKGLLFASGFEKIGLPALADSHWDPIFHRCEDARIPISFHIAFTSMLTDDELKRTINIRTAQDFAKGGTLIFIDCVRAITEVIMTGVCARFPTLNFVAAESGVGWLPFLLEAMDWNWKGGGLHTTHPHLVLPSEVFRRQCYAMYWYEQNLGTAIDMYPDNIMFETDFPHPVSLSASESMHGPTPAEAIERSLGSVDRDSAAKVMFANAARVYNLDVS